MSYRARRGLAAWLMSSPVPLFLLDERGVVLVFNRGCEELTQWTAGEVVGARCEFRSQADPNQVESLTGALCPPPFEESTAVRVQPAVIHRKDGAVLEREIHFFWLPDGEGQGKLHVLGIVTDRSLEAAPAAGLHFDAARHLAMLYERYRLDRLIARSPQMQRVAAQAELARQSSAAVHLVGEPGTGKEHFARLIHYASPNKTSRFAPVRCQSSSHFELQRTFQRLSEQTDPDVRPGVVYLDQVEQLPRDLQRDVLALMQTDGIRWISSSNDGLDTLGENLFDQDLACRLTPLVLRLPPLRQRSDDLMLLAQQILEEGNRGVSSQRTGFTDAVERLFRLYAWPGNIDELSFVIQRASEQRAAGLVDVSDLPYQFLAGMDAQETRPRSRPATLEQQLERVERGLIEAALQSVRGNKTAAAELLGIPRPRLYRRMAALGLGDADDLDGDDAEKPFE